MASPVFRAPHIEVNFYPYAYILRLAGHSCNINSRKRGKHLLVSFQVKVGAAQDDGRHHHCLLDLPKGTVQST
jgi:hypothetical protein